LLLASGGMRRLLDAGKPLRIFVEYWPYGLSKSGGSGENFFRVISEAGFRILRIDSEAKSLITVKRVEDLAEVTRGSRYVNLFCERS